MNNYRQHRNTASTLITLFLSLCLSTTVFGVQRVRAHTSATTAILGAGGNALKQAIVSLSYTGGDGGDNRDVYVGRGAPELELYADGQLVLQRGGKIYEKRLSTREMQYFLARIKRTGIFKLQEGGVGDETDPLYKFDSTTQFSDGAPYIHVLVNNGSTSKQFSVYSRYEKYVVPEMKRTLHLLNTFRPRGLKKYKPKHTLLLIEKGDLSYYSIDNTPPRVWPRYLPTLKSLGEGRIILSGTLASQIGNAFAALPGGHVFVEAGQKYSVLARPLWPDETLEQWGYSP